MVYRPLEALRAAEALWAAELLSAAELVLGLDMGSAVELAAVELEPGLPRQLALQLEPALPMVTMNPAVSRMLSVSL